VKRFASPRGRSRISDRPDPSALGRQDRRLSFQPSALPHCPPQTAWHPRGSLYNLWLSVAGEPAQGGSRLWLLPGRKDLRASVNRTVLALFVSAAGVVGCGPDPIMSHDGPRAPTSAVTPPSGWKVLSSTLTDPQKAIDGDVQTVAVSGGTYENAQITIDLGKRCVFNQVVIDHGPNEYGCARRVAIFTSRDGKDFSQKQYEGPGTRRVTYAILVNPALSRYVRIQVVRQGDYPWSVAELYVR